MIDHNSHHARYCELMALASAASPARQRDGGYMAALYILSADPELCGLARHKISSDGIHFSGISSAARRAELSDSQRTAVKAAHSLFNDGSASVTPHDLAMCDYATLDVITQAMYIWKGGCTITGGEHGEICLDRSDEASRRSVELFLMAQLFDRSNR